MMRPERKVAHAPVKDEELNAAINDDEPTPEQLVEMLKEAVRDVNEGRTRPVDELLHELDEILAEDEIAD